MLAGCEEQNAMLVLSESGGAGGGDVYLDDTNNGSLNITGYFQTINGNLSIGNINPIHRLEVVDTTIGPVARFRGGGVTRVIIDSSGTNTGFRLQTGSANRWSNSAHQEDTGYIDYAIWNDQTSSSGLFINGNSNNMGVGTQAPSSKLHVIGDANITGTVYYGALVANSPHALVHTDSEPTQICIVAIDGKVLLQQFRPTVTGYEAFYIPNSPVCLNKEIVTSQTQVFDEQTNQTTITTNYKKLFTGQTRNTTSIKPHNGYYNR